MGTSKNASADSLAPTFVGTPVSELPLIGVYGGGDTAAQMELKKQLDELGRFLENARSANRVEGLLSFRAVLVKMGMEVPDAMTEAEAAAEFLNRAERFSALLSQWRDAVGKGPWDISSMEMKDRSARRGDLLSAAIKLQGLLGVMSEAHLRTGDTETSWAEVQALNSGADRCEDSELGGFFRFIFIRSTLQPARAGMILGAWTDDQLNGISGMLGDENALATSRRAMDQQKHFMTDTFAHLREPESEIAESFVNSARSPIGKTLNSFGVAMTSDQQIADNLAVIHYQMDQPFTRFDPVTGYYLGESAGPSPELPHSNPDDVSFDKFYYMYAAQYGWKYDSLPNQVIKSQSAIDQTRLAAALEIQHRATGEYPETLDAVSATFGGTPPRDIATGQPYFYQRDADGGYKLWSTGIDRRNDGGNEKTDILWNHRPLNGK